MHHVVFGGQQAAPGRALRAVLVALSFLPLAAGCSEHAGRTMLPAGPYRTLAVGEGAAPFYLVNFDKTGRCESPVTLARVVEDAAAGNYTDVILISHGWNNDWADATGFYNDFLARFEQLRAAQPGGLGRDYRPLFVGVIWPSTLLVTADEQGPVFETAPSGRPAAGDEAVQSADRRQARDLAEQLADGDPLAAGRLQEQILTYLAKGRAATPQDADDLARLLAPVYGQEEIPGRDAAAALKDGAREAARLAAADAPAAGPTTGRSRTPNAPLDSPRPGAAATTPTPPAGEAAPAAEAAAAFAFSDLRWIVRVASVYLMKDRAGVVGDKGVSVLLRELVNRTRARVHLVGHSYGAKVVLAALCAAPGPNRKVDSVLLLQPAISCYSLAAQAPRGGGAGKYREALRRTDKPIYTTFSEKDVPLSDIYQYFVRRPGDMRELARAEAARAGPPGTPPKADDFAALGGFGPQPLPPAELADAEVTWAYLRPAGRRYDLPPHARVVGLRNNGDQIQCHGCVSNSFTWWALWDQLAR